MKTKIIGAAVTAALLGLSGVAFGQGAAAGGAGGSAASGQDTPREASRADAGPGSATSGSAGVVTSGSGSTTVAPTTGTASRCDALTGAEKTRCMRDERASSGASTNPGVPVTQKPGDSGVGAIDKTRPGAEPAGANQANPRDTGTSSAGSGK